MSMFRQIIGKLPRKQTRSSDRDLPSGTAPSVSKPSSGSRGSGDRGASGPVDPPVANSGPGQSGKSSAASTSNKPNGMVSTQANKPLQVPVFEALPSFKDVSNSEKQSLFIRKLNMCCVVFDFTDPSKNMREKDMKRQTLVELVEYVPSANGKFSEQVMQAVTNMVSVNLFRTLRSPPREHKALEVFDLEEEEPVMDPAWVHLQFVYELFLRFIQSSETDAKIAKRYIDHSFVLRLLDLFESEDSRERDYLKMILHRVYGKFMVHRPFIRKAINNIFFQFIYETEKHNGIAELLEILGSIINGFALPLKEEHKLFLIRVLIPLHKPKCATQYHQQLSYCITQFVEKDCKLADTVIRGLLKYWPLTNSSKEVLFLAELEEILEATQVAEFQKCMVPLFRQISRCLNSSHFQVAERALFFWNNDHVENLIRQHSKVILPIILPSLEKNVNSHWNAAVQSLTLNVRKIFTDNDPELYAECLKNYEEEQSKQKQMMLKQEQAWKRMEDVASAKPTHGDAAANGDATTSEAVSNSKASAV